MASEDLVFRLKRMYAAIDAAKEADLGKVPAQVVVSSKGLAMYQDFRAGLADAELSNIVHAIIHNIASLRDHGRRWLAKTGRDKTSIDTLVSRSTPLQLCVDLWNRDKHGGPARDGGLSKKTPRIVNVNRVLQVQATEPGFSVSLGLTPQGHMKKRGSGDASVVVTADVVDEHGNKLGDIRSIAKAAVESLESFFRDQGLDL